MAAFILAASLNVQAQQESAPAATPEPAKATHQQITHEKRVEMRLQRLKTDLSLTDEQLPKIKELLMQQEELRNVKPEERRDAHQAIQAKINEILTPEQKEKQKAMQKERKKKMMERREQMQKKETTDDVAK